MRKIFYIFLTILAAILVFLVIIFLFMQNKGKGALQITASPNAKVYLNDKLIGETPLCKCEFKDMLAEGDYTVKLVPTSGNYKTFIQKISITPKVLTVIDKTFSEQGLGSGSFISLAQIQDTKNSQVSVITFPIKAEVYLDNNKVGVSPVILNNITESDHEVKVTKKGYKEKILRVRAVLGYRLETLIYLGLDPDYIASVAAIPNPLISTSAAELSNKQMIQILDTPTGFLRVRQDSSILSQEIAQTKPGESYELVLEQSGWFKIKLTDGKLGWISSSYAKKIQETK